MRRVVGAHSGGELRVFGQGLLDLLEQALFVVGERHDTPPALVLGEATARPQCL
jgi:hypothetical protein